MVLSRAKILPQNVYLCKQDNHPKKRDRSKETRGSAAERSKLSERQLKYAQEIKKVDVRLSDMVLAGEITLIEAKRLSALDSDAREIAINAVESGMAVRPVGRKEKSRGTPTAAILKAKIECDAIRLYPHCGGIVNRMHGIMVSGGQRTSSLIWFNMIQRYELTSSDSGAQYQVRTEDRPPGLRTRNERKPNPEIRATPTLRPGAPTARAFWPMGT